ncbi:chemerin-like receptor 1 [Ambystoma mexicanum]|uniref:chemerin-like receptor 1 n=1 Tax=Ambystoma mexicanum TaxID=8296 RepID=UPI0037E73043
MVNTTSAPFPASSNTQIDTTPWYEYYDDDEEADQKLQTSFHVLSMVFYSVAFLLGVTGNSLVIWIAGFKMKKTVNTIWFLNLAIADFIFTFFLPLSIAYTAMDFHWPFGTFLCKINSSVAFLNMFASVFLLMAISIDRCFCVVLPVWSQNHRTSWLATRVAIVIWIMAVLISSPYLAFRDTATSFNKENVTLTHCYNNFAFSDNYNDDEVNLLRATRHRAMIITRFVCGFIIPFSSIIACYSIIALRLKRNHLARSSKPFKIIIAVIVCFFICWFPYHIFSILELIIHTSQSFQVEKAVLIGIPLATSLAFLNSCINPILYVFMGQDFKEKFKMSILSAFESAFSEDSTLINVSKNQKSKSVSVTESHFN